MAKKFVEAKFVDGDHTIRVGVTLVLWQDNNVFYQYSPELDLTGYGKTRIEAEASFQYVLEDFLTYTLRKETLFDELERLGWTTNKRKKRVRAPEEDQLLEDNETYKELINRPGVLRSSTDFALSL